MTTSSMPVEPVRSLYADDLDFRELLEEFAAAVPERKRGLLDAHRAGDTDTLQRRAHQLKGAGGGFGFPQLSDLAAGLETACNAHDPAAIAGALESIVAYLCRIAV